MIIWTIYAAENPTIRKLFTFFKDCITTSNSTAYMATIFCLQFTQIAFEMLAVIKFSVFFDTQNKTKWIKGLRS